MPIARVPAFMMSLLRRQLMLAKDTFLTRYPHFWLVWEPGEWSMPGGVDVSVAETKAGGTAGSPQRPLRGDALCFALKVPEGTTLKVGRAADNEVLLSDMAISRLHAQLALQGGVWSVTARSETKKTTVDGKELAQGQALPLRSGQLLGLGEMTVSFYDGGSFKDRLEQAGPKPKR